MAEKAVSNHLLTEVRESFGKGAARKIRATGKIPAVIYGKGLRSSHPGQAKVIVLPFKTAHGELHIEICAEVA
jgi:large subunit ribosomal protein L25